MATKDAEAKEPEPADIIRPILNTSMKWYAAIGILSAVALAWLAAFGFQLQEGLIVTNLADWGSGGGVTWGLYIGAFIWWVGIAHGGIILSAAVRLFGMTKYQPVARMAELLTLTALSMSGLYIVVHMGRPDRLVTSVVNAYPWTVQSSPLAWDVTVITLYFVMTATYIALTLRYDTYQLRDRLPDILDPLYRVVLIGYSEKEDEVIERMAWWLALGIIVMAPLLLHGGVIPWLFSLIPSMPGWDGAIQGPQFLSIALTSALAGLIVISYTTRIAYDWEHIFTDSVIRGLTNWLGIFSLMFVWLQLQQIINGLFAAHVRPEVVMTAKLSNTIYQMAMVTMFLALAYIFAQAVKPSVFSRHLSLVAALGVLVATLSEKILFVFEGLAYPEFGLYDQVPGHYSPSLVELSSVAGTVALCTLMYMVIMKLFPIIELHSVEDHDDDHDNEEVSA
ncbi:NrfD/PsrC family molybdoenzyme membrane anchor subunit [Halovenus rubra]|uniref:NrfD/PsrC family molybdoenzyme membrane anchor subunit n=2 Tax=Halovenus rubra TaxID=869890 RepID=A0ACC7DX95_9EURY|nr:NrfD/PsrC family molybdoenzyme membrane anchor subunit [Halovenus rubra]